LLQDVVNNLKKFKVSFNGYCDPDINWTFEPVERELVVNAGETAIVFYRLYNR
jgi:cytochrome c oxidase assembly protein subunit 11